MDGEFIYDAALFRNAELAILDAEEKISSANHFAKTVKSGVPDGFEFRDDVFSACDLIEQTKSYLLKYKESVALLRGGLSWLNSDFGRDVYVSTWQEDFKNAASATKADWKKGFNSLLKGNGFKDLKTAYNNTNATFTVVKKSAGRGVSKVFENIADAGRYVKAGFQKGEKRQKTMDKIAEDRTGKKYEAYFNSAAGKAINAKSHLKYDSKGAQKITSVSQKATDVAIATGATMLTGGAGALATGFVVGAGRGAEKYTQSVDRKKGEKYDYKKGTWEVLKSGAKTGATYMVDGAMGGAAIKIVKGGGLKTAATAAKKIIENPKSVVSPQAIQEGIKKSVFSKDFAATSVNKTTEHVARVNLGEETTDEAVKKVVSGVIQDTIKTRRGNAVKSVGNVLTEGEKLVAGGLYTLGKNEFYKTDMGKKLTELDSSIANSMVDNPVTYSALESVFNKAEIENPLQKPSVADLSKPLIGGAKVGAMGGVAQSFLNNTNQTSEVPPSSNN